VSDKEDIESSVDLKGELENAEKAFSFYKSLGEERTFDAVVEEFNIPFDKVADWASLLGWEERIGQVKKEHSRRESEKFIRDTSEIRNKSVDVLNMLLRDLTNSSLGLPLSIRSTMDLANVMKCLEMITKTDLAILDIKEKIDSSEGETTDSYFDVLKKAGLEDMEKFEEGDEEF